MRGGGSGAFYGGENSESGGIVVWWMSGSAFTLIVAASKDIGPSLRNGSLYFSFMTKYINNSKKQDPYIFLVNNLLILIPNNQKPKRQGRIPGKRRQGCREVGEAGEVVGKSLFNFCVFVKVKLGSKKSPRKLNIGTFGPIIMGFPSNHNKPWRRM